MAQTINSSITSRLITDLMMDLGLTQWQAAALVGDFAHETGNFKLMQEDRPASGRGGLGWARWTGPRREKFRSISRRADIALTIPKGIIAAMGS